MLPSILLAALSTPVMAQDGHQVILNQLGEAGGRAQAAVEICDIKGVPDNKDQQMQMFISMGGNADQFNRLYDQGYDTVKKQFGSASPQDKAKMCTEFKNFSQGYAQPISR